MNPLCCLGSFLKLGVQIEKDRRRVGGQLSCTGPTEGKEDDRDSTRREKKDPDIYCM